VKYFALLLLALTMACASLAQGPREFYLTQQPYTFADSTADSARVNVPERLQFQINAFVLRSRANEYEEAGCIAARTDGHEWWLVGDLAQATHIERIFNDRLESYHCPRGTVALHVHWIARANRCAVSGMDTDPINATVGIPVYLVACGLGVDSLVAYRVKPRPLVPPRKADLGSP